MKWSAFIVAVLTMTALVADADVLLRAGTESADANLLQTTEEGLHVNRPGAYQGYTLIAPMTSTRTYLIDMQGRVVKEWKSEYTPALSAYLLENGHLLRPCSRGEASAISGAGGRIQEFDWDGKLVWDYLLPERYLPHHDICRLPNGNILLIAVEQKPVRQAISAGRRPETVGEQLLCDCILEIEPTGTKTGQIVWEWHAWDHLIQDVDERKPNYGIVSEHPELIDVNFGPHAYGQAAADPQQMAQLRSLGYVGSGTRSAAQAGAAERQAVAAPGRAARTRGRRNAGFDMSGDWMHSNALSYNAELDQIMLSVREFSEIWIIDHSTTTAEAKSHAGGKSGKGGDLLYRWGNPRSYRNGTNVDRRLYAQHSAHWIPDGCPGAGHALVFNNGNGRPDGTYSSVDELVLPVNPDGLYDREEFLAYGPRDPVWTYTAPEKANLYSMVISGAQRLPNGNTFICSGIQGLLFEITPEAEIVWLYKHPGTELPDARPDLLLSASIQQVLQLTDEQKNTLGRLQDRVDVEIVQLLTEQQQTLLDEFREAATGGPSHGPTGLPPRPGAVIPLSLIGTLRLTDVQSATLVDLQSRVDLELLRMLSPDQQMQLQGMMNAFVAGFATGQMVGAYGGVNLLHEYSVGLGGMDGVLPAYGGRPGGPRGVFRSYRYGADYPGLKDKILRPGPKLEDVAVDE